LVASAHQLVNSKLFDVTRFDFRRPALSAMWVSRVVFE
jgi:hypothetical protein